MTRRTRGLALGAAALVAIALGVTAVSGGEKQRYRYGGKPTVEVSGRVYDHATQQGLEGAYVIVALESWKGDPLTGHGNSGCTGAEVLRTDVEGRYRFVWDWKQMGREPPRDVSVLLRVYMPGWEYYPVERRGGTPWQTPNSPSPDFAMMRDAATLDQRLVFVARINDNECTRGPRADTFLDLYEAQHREIWAAICTPEGEAFADLSWERYYTLEGYAMGPPLFAMNLIERSTDTTRRYERIYAMQDRARKNLPAFQRPGPEFSFQRSYRDLTSDEKAIACRDFRADRTKEWVVP